MFESPVAEARDAWDYGNRMLDERDEYKRRWRFAHKVIWHLTHDKYPYRDGALYGKYIDNFGSRATPIEPKEEGDE